MSIPLGAVELSDHLVLKGLDTVPLRATMVQRSLYGVALYNNGVALSGGMALSLSSENHVTYEQLQLIRALELSGEVVTLVHPRGTFLVRVTGNDLEPDAEIVDPYNDPELWYSGNIYLLTV